MSVEKRSGAACDGQLFGPAYEMHSVQGLGSFEGWGRWSVDCSSQLGAEGIESGCVIWIGSILED